jgi:hypothetical protein
VRKRSIGRKLSWLGMIAGAAWLSTGSAAQSQVPNDINATVGRLLERMRITEPYSAAQDELGLELVEAVIGVRGVGVSEQTIDRMASIVESGDAHVRVFISHALRIIGPSARRALPALEKAAEADLEVAKQFYGFTVGPDGPYEAEKKAIDAITSTQPPPR